MLPSVPALLAQEADMTLGPCESHVVDIETSSAALEPFFYSPLTTRTISCQDEPKEGTSWKLLWAILKSSDVT